MRIEVQVYPVGGKITETSYKLFLSSGEGGNMECVSVSIDRFDAERIIEVYKLKECPSSEPGLYTMYN